MSATVAFIQLGPCHVTFEFGRWFAYCGTTYLGYAATMEEAQAKCQEHAAAHVVNTASRRAGRGEVLAA